MGDVGELQPLGIIVRDKDTARTPINAVTVSLTIVGPDQVPVVAAVANPPGVTGYYTYDLVPLMPGHYVYRWETTSPDLVLEGSFDALPRFSAGLMELADAKKLLRIEDDDQDDDIRSVIRAATRAAENEADDIIARREFTQTIRVRSPRRSITVAQGPIISVTRVVDRATGTEWPGNVLEVDENGIVDSLAMPFRGRLRVECIGGYLIVPDHYRVAIGYILQHLWQNWIGTGKPRVGGQAASASDDSGMGYSIPNRAKDLLGHPGPKVG